MIAPVRPTRRFDSLSTSSKAASDSSNHLDPENTSTPSFTPSDTPPQIATPDPTALPTLGVLQKAKMEGGKLGGSKAKEDVQPVTTDNSATQTDTKPPRLWCSKKEKEGL